MKYIDKNSKLISELLEKDVYIRDSRILTISINEINKSIDVQYLTINGLKIKLVFIEVLEYQFYYELYKQQEISHCKFFEKDGEIYFCTDPYVEEDIKDSRDQDYIISRNVEGYFIE